MMNGAHFHFVVNNVQVVAFLFATTVLIMALFTSDRVRWVGAGFLAVAFGSVGTLLSFLSGSAALDVVTGIPRTSARALSHHRVRAVVASALAALAAVTAVLASLVKRKRGGEYGRLWLAIVLVPTLASTAAFAWTGLAGGRINHPEIYWPSDRESRPAHPH